MRMLGKFILLFFLFAAPSTADIRSVKIRSHNRDIIFFSEFEYPHTGYVSVAVSSVGISSIPVTSNSSQPDPSRIGFFLLSDELRHRYNLEFDRNPDLCALDIKFITVLYTFQNLAPPPHSSFNKSYNVIYPGKYSLYFANCNDLSLVTMDVRTELYNTNDDGTTKDYLSAEQPQPSLYFNFFYIYLCFLSIWIEVCFRNKQYFQKLHLVMGVLLVMTLLNLSARGWINMISRLQVWGSVSYTVVGQSVSYIEEHALNESFGVIDGFCCFVVFFHTFCSGIAFKEAKDTSTFMRSFISIKETSVRPDVFPFVFLVYIIFLRWTTEEIGNLLFYIVMFYLFRPFDLDDEGTKGAGILNDTDNKV
ncbi:unnamed protein product [Lactuca saligna]|uniref:CAND6/7 N-terminal domain-containing protein n=1 Tax=Lactuca saligna TaxID=75948 RepID=A0AA35YRL7_LACSI|nr:unnamed protein product [Lactuca saligna]